MAMRQMREDVGITFQDFPKAKEAVFEITYHPPTRPLPVLTNPRYQHLSFAKRVKLLTDQHDNMERLQRQPAKPVVKKTLYIPKENAPFSLDTNNPSGAKRKRFMKKKPVESSPEVSPKHEISEEASTVSSTLYKILESISPAITDNRPPTKWKCEVCDQVYFSDMNFALHMSSHYNDKTKLKKGPSTPKRKLLSQFLNKDQRIRPILHESRTIVKKSMQCKLCLRVFAEHDYVAHLNECIFSSDN